MKVSNKNKIVIPGRCLCKNKIVHVKVILKKVKSTLVKGTVKNPDGSPSVGACIEIVEVTTIKKILGCTFTDAKGDFSVAIKCNFNAYYEFNIYSSV
ncbi:carboxypeptidase regulatory-like domain-containing protein [Clostridium uliginosum]|uniref:Carboxypeptidase regulatory-like domain-containing protein n=1 Tax=Clostridium uliginosum TaxID=119641 RepID=A0A1I1HF96_9CLOT|nr:carboxypeptidase regulatory-like domain-containing protein [Clostridium uliginosum]SFC22634.1 hypothetical protein SAMN05421842_101289 [Clostridium uliginosum]